MSVYVDDMRARFGRMVMCHMIADTSEELHAMAARIGVARRWCQDEGTYREHYDIALTKRAAAVAAGAIEVTQLGLGRIMRVKRAAVPISTGSGAAAREAFVGHLERAPQDRWEGSEVPERQLDDRPHGGTGLPKLVRLAAEGADGGEVPLHVVGE